MKNPEFKYVVTWDGYSQGSRDGGYAERKICGVTDLEHCSTVVNMHKDASPRAYHLQSELDVAEFFRQHEAAVEKEKAEKKAALDKLTDHDRKVLGL